MIRQHTPIYQMMNLHKFGCILQTIPGELKRQIQICLRAVFPWQIDIIIQCIKNFKIFKSKDLFHLQVNKLNWLNCLKQNFVSILVIGTKLDGSSKKWLANNGPVNKAFTYFLFKASQHFLLWMWHICRMCSVSSFMKVEMNGNESMESKNWKWEDFIWD